MKTINPAHVLDTFWIYDLINWSKLDILVLAEAYIRPSDTDDLLDSLTLADYNFIQKQWGTGQCSGVGSGVETLYSHSIVTTLDLKSFKSIILSLKSDDDNFVVAFLYYPPGSWFRISGFLRFSVLNWLQFHHLQ